jgi:hypothetical protein
MNLTIPPAKLKNTKFDNRLIGPNHLNFKKMTPKTLETDEDILTSSNLPSE